jgi:hypothetical protein
MNSPTGVKQFYTEASATLKTYTGSSVSVDGVCYLKGVTINPSGTTCNVKIYSGSSAVAASLIYSFKGGTAAGDVYQEYIAANGIRCAAGMYIERVAATTSVAVIWQ